MDSIVLCCVSRYYYFSAEKNFNYVKLVCTRGGLIFFAILFEIHSLITKSEITMYFLAQAKIAEIRTNSFVFRVAPVVYGSRRKKSR